MDLQDINKLCAAALDADYAWQAAFDADGIDRYSAVSGTGKYAELFAAKVETYAAYRAAFRSAA